VKIEIHNFAPVSDFKTLRSTLILKGEKFSPETLPQVPYEQLFLCCTGEAGTARCDRAPVLAERRSRRQRFLNMETNELEASGNFLRVNQMDEDVKFDQTIRMAPKWENLSSRQQVWAKLHCIHNHIDNPQIRLKEAILLLRTCAEENDLPMEVAKSFMVRLRGLLSVFPGRLTETLFRIKIGEITDNLFEFLPEEETTLLQREEIQDYNCSSDCYRVVV
jgi:hypothetical protein